MGPMSLRALQRTFSAIVALVCSVDLYANDGAVGAPAAAPSVEDPIATLDAPDFNREVLPLLARRCFACHGNDQETRAAGLRLDVREDALAPRGGSPAIVPGAPDDSELWLRVTDAGDPMPPPSVGAPLEPEELDTLRRWILAGAPYSPHWAFVPPTRPEPPALDGAAPWGRSELDAFVAARLTEAGLAPSPEADPATLLRRVSLDLTGLPPSTEETRAFLARVHATGDDRAAYDAVYAAEVERLLASPHYGERWAAMWLDLARYADSAGHGSDPLRTIWRYRDWVIDAFDRNLPLDEFARLQLAGDLVPEPTVDTRLATAFHRNTMTNTEGGTDDEEFRVLAVKDRVNTTGQVFLGLTVGCAECHSHKYDPLTQREYYALYDFFNHTADTDQNDDRPRLATPTAAQAEALQRIEAEIAAVEAELAAFEPDLAAGAARLVAAELGWRSAGEWAPAASPDGVRTDVVTVLCTEPVTALRLRARTSPDLPRGGPGQSEGNGNFVVSEVRIDELPAPRGLEPRLTRLRIELPGERRILSLAEVEVLGHAGESLGRGGRARQSSTDFGGPPELAVDGNTSGAFDDGSVTHTRTERDPWWELELELASAPRLADVREVRVWNRTDGDLEQRLDGASVVLLDALGNELWRSAPLAPPDPVAALTFAPEWSTPARITAASASHEQAGFGVAAAFDGKLGSGWAIGPEQGSDHEAVFTLRTSSGLLGFAPAPPDGRSNVTRSKLRVTLVQEFGGAHTLGRFELATTALDPPPRAMPAAVRRALERTPDAWDAADRAALREHLLADDPVASELRARRTALVQQKSDLDIVTTPILVELQGERRRATHVLHKGNFLAPGERVYAGTPAALHPFGDRERDRLGLAEWLFDPANPLTARVTANRLWARLFGRGLVATEEDFGAQGALPTHPELLDWLATELQSNGWDQKAFLRTLVTSSTYRQSSTVTADALRIDPDGSLLSRFPRQRLDAELVRDVTLAAAGLLSPKKFGPSVFPPQPAGLWQAAFNGERDWQESMGEDRWRRGLYVFLRRTTPYPMLQTFDAPSREVCTLKRPRTNTPLQAFITLNDPVFVEAAQALGRLAAAATDDLSGVELVLERATQRAPMPAQVAELSSLLQDARLAFREDTGAARAFATAPLGPLPDGLDSAEAAAWTLVASTALNLDATLTKE
jgi:hypothetical protein